MGAGADSRIRSCTGQAVRCAKKYCPELFCSGSQSGQVFCRFGGVRPTVGSMAFRLVDQASSTGEEMKLNLGSSVRKRSEKVDVVCSPAFSADNMWRLNEKR